MSEMDDGLIFALFEKASRSGGGGSYHLPTASATVKGGVKIGAGLSMEDDVLSVTGGGSVIGNYKNENLTLS